MNYYGGFGGGVGGYGAWPPAQPQPEAAPGEEDEEDEEDGGKGKGILPVWGNEKSMNLNHLILTNIQGSLYFKTNLFELKTYHEVVDEIYYKVTHLEPWEKGSRRTAGQTGMCGGVRGVGSGGIVSSCFCILYKLFTLKLTRKQVNGLINHRDSPYIRGLGFMFIRYCQPPADIWDWFEPYLNDEEEVDPKAGGGNVICVGEMLRQFLTKLDWYSALFPRIPVPIQKQIDAKMREFGPFRREGQEEEAVERYDAPAVDNNRNGNGRGGSVGGDRLRPGERGPPPADVTRALKDLSPSRGESSRRSHGKERRRSRSRSRERSRRSRSRDRKRSSSKDRHRGKRSSSRDRHHHKRRHHDKGGDFGDELNREKDRQKRDKERRRSRSRSGEKRKRSRDRKRSKSRDRSGGRSKGRSRDRSRDRKDRR